MLDAGARKYGSEFRLLGRVLDLRNWGTSITGIGLVKDWYWTGAMLELRRYLIDCVRKLLLSNYQLLSRASCCLRPSVSRCLHIAHLPCSTVRPNLQAIVETQSYGLESIRGCRLGWSMEIVEGLEQMHCEGEHHRWS